MNLFFSKFILGICRYPELEVVMMIIQTANESFRGAAKFRCWEQQ